MKTVDEILCMLGFHQWTKWKEISRGIITAKERYLPLTGEKLNIGMYVRQERVCNICGKIQLRDEEST